MRSVAWLVAGTTLISAGCATTKTIPPPASGREEIGIVGYRLADGREQPFAGIATVGSDSIQLHARHRGESKTPSVRPDTVLMRSDVGALKVRELSPPRTVALLASPVAVWYVAFLLGGFQGSDE